MNELNTFAAHDAPTMLTVRINVRRAQMLWHTAAPAAPFDLDEGFEALDNEGDISTHDAHSWAAGTIMWCEGALEAMTLADYETNDGFHSRLLWDLCCEPDWPGGYAVLTSRPYGSWH